MERLTVSNEKRTKSTLESGQKSENTPSSQKLRDCSEYLRRSHTKTREKVLVQREVNRDKHNVARINTTVRGFCAKLERFKHHQIEQGIITQTPYIF